MLMNYVTLGTLLTKLNNSKRQNNDNGVKPAIRKAGKPARNTAGKPELLTKNLRPGLKDEG